MVAVHWEKGAQQYGRTNSRNGIHKQLTGHMGNTGILEMKHCPVAEKVVLRAFIDNVKEGGFFFLFLRYGFIHSPTHFCLRLGLTM